MRTSVLIALFGAACLLTANADPARAQATRTWVHDGDGFGLVGSDAHTCTRFDPCRTFAGAIAKTAAGGEISCASPGNYGIVTITKSITIDCGGNFGGILTGSTDGITVNGSNIIVILRNLSLNGNYVGLVGINFISGLSLELDNVNVYGFTAGSALGVRFAPNTPNSILQVNSSTITTNGIAPSTGGGIAIAPVSGSNAVVVINNTTIENNALGIAAASTSGPITMTVRESLIANNRSYGVIAAAGSPINLAIHRTTISNNFNTGVLANGANSLVRIDNSLITGNATGVASTGGGVLRSFKNNAIKGNGSDGTPIPPDNLD